MSHSHSIDSLLLRYSFVCNHQICEQKDWKFVCNVTLWCVRVRVFAVENATVPHLCTFEQHSLSFRREPSSCVWSTIYCISALVTQCIKSNILLQLVTFGYMFRPYAVAQWLRCCATNRKVDGSIPAGVIGFFH